LVLRAAVAAEYREAAYISGTSGAIAIDVGL